MKKRLPKQFLEERTLKAGALGDLDEIVAYGAIFHIEQMDTHYFWFSVTVGEETRNYHVGSKRAPVTLRRMD